MHQTYRTPLLLHLFSLPPPAILPTPETKTLEHTLAVVSFFYYYKRMCETWFNPELITHKSPMECEMVTINNAVNVVIDAHSSHTDIIWMMVFVVFSESFWFFACKRLKNTHTRKLFRKKYRKKSEFLHVVFFSSFYLNSNSIYLLFFFYSEWSFQNRSSLLY